jgi:hypothetical protein
MTSPCSLVAKPVKQGRRNDRIRLRGLDWLVGTIIAVLTLYISVAYLEQHGLGEFYQREFAPAVMLACEGELTNVSLSNLKGLEPADKSRIDPAVALNDFLNEKSDHFECSLLPKNAAEFKTALDLYQRSTYYLLAISGAVWRLTGVAWRYLIAVAAGMAIVSAIFLYAFSRLFVGSFFAFAVTACVMVSPLQGLMLPDLRDYSKQPFFLAFLFFTGYLTTVLNRPRLMLLAAASAGLAAGLGLGFRADLFLAVPFFLLTIVLCLFWEPAVLKGPLLGVLAAVVGFLVPALPILLAYSGGGALGHVAFLGLMVPFNGPLGIRNTVYDVGHLYHDVYAAHFLAIAHQLEFGGTSLPMLSPEYNGFSLHFLWHYLMNFPADVLLRAYAALQQIAALGVENSTSYLVGIGDHRLPFILSSFALYIVIGAGIALFISSARLGLFFLCSFGYFAGLCAIQFAIRHWFYLELFYWLGLAVILSSIFKGVRWVWLEWTQSRELKKSNFDIRAALPRVRSACVLLMIIVPGGMVALFAARAYQDNHIRSLIEGYLQEPGHAVVTSDDARGASVLIRPTVLNDLAGHAVELHQVTPDDYYLRAVIDERLCPNQVFSLNVVYDQPNGNAGFASNDFSRKLRTFLPGQGKAYFFIPIRDTEDHRFTGLEVAPTQRRCLQGIEAISKLRAPLPLWLTLPSDWHAARLFESLDSPLWPWNSDTKLIDPGGLLPVYSERDHEIGPLPAASWAQLVRPATLKDQTIEIRGISESASSYAAVSCWLNIKSGEVVAAKGIVRRGGLALGLLDRQNHWATLVAIGSGAFLAVTTAPVDGEYQIVVANNLPAGIMTNDATVHDVGFFGRRPPPCLSPANHHAEAPVLRSLGTRAFDELSSPAPNDKHRPGISTRPERTS